MTNYTIPAVHTALAKILKELSVEKGGTLPSNMGGKPYITAADLSAEIKRKFVENGLVHIPSEKTIHHEVVKLGSEQTRFVVTIVIEGTYTVVATEDGSSVTLTGVGDGVATGTAVASNIASTNALKNAFLRLFLVTEQSVEDAAKNGSEEPASTGRKSPAERHIERAERAKGGKTLGDLSALVKAQGREISEVGEMADKMFNEPKGSRTWNKDPERIAKVYAAVQNGEV